MFKSSHHHDGFLLWELMVGIACLGCAVAWSASCFYTIIKQHHATELRMRALHIASTTVDELLHDKPVPEVDDGDVRVAVNITPTTFVADGTTLMVQQLEVIAAWDTADATCVIKLYAMKESGVA